MSNYFFAAILFTSSAIAQVQIDSAPQYEDIPPPPFKMTAKEVAEFAKTSRGAVVSILKDPSSAQFRGMFLSHGRELTSTSVAHPVTLCGEINAKNTYGGYVGFRRFVARPNYALIQQDDNGSLFAELTWNRQCSKRLREVK